MAGSTKLVVLGGPPGNPPPVGTVAVYPKSDELLYFQGSDSVEHLLAGQIEAGALIKGSDGSILAGGFGIANVVYNGVGDMTVTLVDPTNGATMPRATVLDSSFGDAVCDLTTPPPCSVINVFTFDEAGVPKDASNILFNMIRLATAPA